MTLRHPGTGEASLITAADAGLGNAHRGDRYGESLASADFDNDRGPDLAIGAPGRDMVFLLYGADDAPVRRGEPLRASRLSDPPRGGWFGFSLTAGDLNGDGYDDLVVGTPGTPADRGNGVPGSIHLFFGGEEGLSTDRVRRLEAPENEHEGFGRFVELGDLDRDGDLDLVEGTLGEPDNDVVGHGSLCRGEPKGPTSCEPLPDSSGSGTSALAIADLDGDRYPEIVQGDQMPYDGSSTRVGEVRLWGGSKHGPMAEPLVITQEDAGLAQEEDIEFGHAVEAGDVNDDGLADAIIGARYYGEAGAVSIIYGAKSAAGKPRVDVLDHDPDKGDGFGETLALLDLNADHRLDLVVGVSMPASLDDAAVVFMGSPGGLGNEKSLGGMDGLATLEGSPLRIGR